MSVMMKWDLMKCCFPEASGERFMNMCRHHNIELDCVCRKNEKIVFDITARDYKKLHSICKKMKNHPHILAKKGVVFKILSAQKNWTFFAGVILMFLSVLVQTRFVWNINFEGNHKYSEETLLRDLKNQHVYRGMLRRNIVGKKIEANMRRNYEGISWVSAEENGSVLNIYLKEKNETEKIRERSPGNVVASVDGTVKCIAVERGVAKVKKGSKVKKGQILIEGIVPEKNDEGKVTKQKFVEAKGEIVLQAEQKVERDYSNKTTKKVYTGEKSDAYMVKFGNRCLTFANPLKNFDNSGKYDIINNVCAGIGETGEEGWFQIIHKEFFENKKIVCQYSEQEIKSLGQQYFERLVKDLQNSGKRLISKKMNVSKVADQKWHLAGKICFEQSTMDYKEIQNVLNDGGMNGEKGTGS